MSPLILWAPFVFGVFMTVTAGLSLQGRLPKNDWIGIRMHVVMRDAHTWEVGNRAAAPWLLGGGAAELVGGAALILLRPATKTGTPVAFGLLLLAFIVYGIAAWAAQRAVRRLG